MASRAGSPESDLQRLRRAARDGDHAALLPLSDAYEEAGDTEAAAIARTLSTLLATWRLIAGPEVDGVEAWEGQPPLFLNVMLSADGSWSLAELRNTGTAGHSTFQAVSLTPSPAPEPDVAKLLERFAQLHDLAECIGRTLDLPTVRLSEDRASQWRHVHLGDDQHLGPWGGRAVTCILFGR